MQASLLVYDIPSRLSNEIPNPSPRLRRLGVRINLSCWVIPQDMIPWPYLDELKRKGADWKLARFDAGDIDNLRSIIQSALKEQVKEIADSCRKTIKRLDQRLHDKCRDAENANENYKARSKYISETKAAIKRAKKMLADIEQAAGNFGVKSQPGGHLKRVREVIGGLEMSAKARARIYTDMARGVADPTLSKAAEEGVLPPEVLADIIEEQGGNAESLRLAFADA